MRTQDFHYDLPQQLIAGEPLAERSASRLLMLNPDGAVTHGRFGDIRDQLKSGDCLVLNDTKVINARLFGTKASGGRAELLFERLESETQGLFQVRVSKALKPGGTLTLAGDITATVIGREGQFYRLSFTTPLLPYLDTHGEVPLPPYMQREPQRADSERYQTVYADKPGAVAAPTAGLHFDQPLLDELAAQGVHIAKITLHVGAGTFQPVRVEDVDQHVMHAERFCIDADTADLINTAKVRGGRVVAVGTTVVRTLESAWRDGAVRAGWDETALFITPGFQFHVVDKLVTNFHLPCSTLLMLVAAFAGQADVMRAYQQAIAESYRFFSYGDAMLLSRKESERV